LHFLQTSSARVRTGAAESEHLNTIGEAMPYSFTSNIMGRRVHSWTALAASTNGTTIEIDGTAGAVGSVQIEGTFGGTVTLQASNDGAVWYPVLDLAGVAIALTAAGMKDFSTAALYLRPSAGAGVSSVTVTVVLRG